jgi:hypothetical protein
LEHVFTTYLIGGDDISLSAIDIPGTVLDREYHGEVYVVYCRQGYYEYSRRKYRTLTTIAGEISGTYCSGPNFFSVKTRMYMLPSKDLHPEKMEFVPDK